MSPIRHLAFLFLCVAGIASAQEDVWVLVAEDQGSRCFHIRMKNGVPSVHASYEIARPTAGEAESTAAETHEVMVDWLKKLRERAGHKRGAPFVIVVDDTVVLPRWFELPGSGETNPLRDEDLIKYEARQQIPFPLKDVHWDYVQTDRNVMLYAIRSNEWPVSTLEAAGIGDAIIVPGVVCFKNLHRDPSTASVFALGHATRSIQMYGYTSARTFARKVWSEDPDEIATELSRTIGFFRSAYKVPQDEFVSVSAVAYSLPELSGTKIRPNPWLPVFGDASLSANAFIALGAALEATKPESARVNLLSNVEPVDRSYIVWRLAALLVLVLIVALPWIVPVSRHAEFDRVQRRAHYYATLSGMFVIVGPFLALVLARRQSTVFCSLQLFFYQCMLYPLVLIAALLAFFDWGPPPEIEYGGAAFLFANCGLFLWMLFRALRGHQVRLPLLGSLVRKTTTCGTP